MYKILERANFSMVNINQSPPSIAAITKGLEILNASIITEQRTIARPVQGLCLRMESRIELFFQPM